MRNDFVALKNAVKALTALAGLLAIAGWVLGFVYMDRRLHETSQGHKYGPARHLGYFSDVIHRTSRAIDEAAVSTYSKAAAEDAMFYDSLTDAREDAVHGARYASDESYSKVMDEIKRREANRPAPEDIIIAEDTNPYDRD